MRGFLGEGEEWDGGAVSSFKLALLVVIWWVSEGPAAPLSCCSSSSSESESELEADEDEEDEEFGAGAKRVGDVGEWRGLVIAIVRLCSWLADGDVVEEGR